MNRFQPIKHSETECRFCDFLTPLSKHAPVDTPWLLGASYAAFVSIGALVPGWSLIVPKNHKINLTEDYTRTDFWNFVESAASILKDQYGDFSIFEHGAFNFDSQTSCGTGHAHLHMVPLSFSLFEEAQAFDKTLRWEKCLASQISEKSKNSEYLYVADHFQGEHTQGNICVLTKETSQFFRKVIATKLGIPDSYDYKKSKMLDTTLQSFETLSSNVWNSLKNTRSA
jgi:diadenosine tetraphosphate (Ap4A) HIT family hydrolase